MFEKIAIIGGGAMGRGIAQVCAQNGFKTVLYDSNPNIRSTALKTISQDLKHYLLFRHINEQQAAQALSNLSIAHDLDSTVHQTQLIIEAIIEDQTLKKQLFQNLEKMTDQNTILASNTSSLSITAIAHTLQNPERVLGLHFFNPPPAMKLTEVIWTNKTSSSTLKRAQEFILKIGKTPIKAKDSPGFIVNRVMRPFFSEALRLFESGQAGMQDIDNACCDQGHAPMGPFALSDLIGLDVSWAAGQSLYEALAKPERLKPRTIHQKLIQEGDLGRKTGRGFYLYKGRRIIRDNPKITGMFMPKNTLSPQEIWQQVAQAIIQEAQLLINEGIADQETINTAIKLGANFPTGPFEWNFSKSQQK